MAQMHHWVFGGNPVIYSVDDKGAATVRSGRRLVESDTRIEGLLNTTVSRSFEPHREPVGLDEGSFSSFQLIEMAGRVFLRIKEYHSLFACFGLGGNFGLGGIRFDLGFPIEIVKGTLEGFNRGEPVRFETTEAANALALRQMKEAVLRASSVGSRADADQAIRGLISALDAAGPAHGLVFDNALGALVNELLKGGGRSLPESVSLSDEIRKTASDPGSLREVQELVLAIGKAQTVAVTAARQEGRFAGHGTKDRFVVEYPPRQEFEVQIRSW